MVAILFALTALLYFVASSFYVAFLARGDERFARIGTGALAVGVLSHLGFLLIDSFVLGHLPFFDIHEALALASLLVVLGWMVTLRTKPLLVLGAFITPVTLLLFLASGFRRGVAEVAPEVRSLLLPFHVSANILGLVAYALAFGVGLAYVLQERQLRKKQLGGIFQRLPPLDVLDSLGFRLVLIGFPLFTAGMITGTVWAVRIDPAAPSIDGTQVLGVVAWVLFAVVLSLRVAAGWRGRRAAIGTMLGFLCACAVLIGYMFRQTGGT